MNVVPGALATLPFTEGAVGSTGGFDNNGDQGSGTTESSLIIEGSGMEPSTFLPIGGGLEHGIRQGKLVISLMTKI